MATESGGNRQDEIKTQFAAREGIYKLSSLSEYSRPSRANYSDTGNSSVAVSFTPLSDGIETPHRICFNIGKELYVYPFKGLRKVCLVCCNRIYECHGSLAFVDLCYGLP